MLECTLSAYELLVAQNWLYLQNSASQEGFQTRPQQTSTKDLGKVVSETVKEMFSHSIMCNSLWLWTVPLSMDFPRQEYWSGLPFPSSGDLPNPGTEPGLPHCVGRFFTVCATREATPNSLHLWWDSSQLCVLLTAWVFQGRLSSSPLPWFLGLPWWLRWICLQRVCVCVCVCM